jgi:hypothetical protein
MRVPFSFGLVCAVVGCADGYLDRDVQVVYQPESGAAVLSLTGSITTDRFPESPEASTHTDAQLFVIDLDESTLALRQLVGINASYDDAELLVRGPFATGRCVELRFGFVILDGVRDTNDSPIGRTRAFDDAFESSDTFGPLRAALVSIGVELASVAGATLFTSSAACE